MDAILTAIREKRNDLLQRSDKYVLPDFPHDSAVLREAWILYRIQLREFPSSIDLTQFDLTQLNPDGTPTELRWPNPPRYPM